MKLTVKEISLVAIFPALMAATAGISIPLGNLPAISLQTIFVFLAALLLGPKLGSISMIIYILMGAIGLPVFSNYKGGISVILSGSGGFFVGFILSTIFIGFTKNIKFLNKNYYYLFGILVAGNIIIYMCGGAYLSYLTNTSLFGVLAIFTPYFIGDFIKIMIVLYVYSRIRYEITYEHA